MMVVFTYSHLIASRHRHRLFACDSAAAEERQEPIKYILNKQLNVARNSNRKFISLVCVCVLDLP